MLKYAEGNKAFILTTAKKMLDSSIVTERDYRLRALTPEQAIMAIPMNPTKEGSVRQLGLLIRSTAGRLRRPKSVGSR
jgi:hypothetical protein